MRLLITALSLLLVLSSVHADQALKRDVTITKLSDVVPQRLQSTPLLSAGDTCMVLHAGEIAWRIDGWVFGNELYKGLLDPGAVCPGGYPFEVREVHMVMAFDTATPLNVSVDIEAADFTDPDCPVPGALLTMSSEYQNQVPDSGLYDIGIPLDEPYTVTEPFFAGFFISNSIDQSIGAAVVTDTNAVLCTSYNIWDDSIGFIDLVNNQFYNFPGRLVIFAGGSSVEIASCCQVRGNINGGSDKAVNVSDVTYLVQFMFREGPPPICLEEGNVNGDAEGDVNISDLTYLVAYMFKQGPEPPPCP